MGMKTTQERIKKDQRVRIMEKRRTDLNKSGEKYIYIWRERNRTKRKKGEGLNNVHVIQKKGNNWTKERLNTLASN